MNIDSVDFADEIVASFGYKPEDKEISLTFRSFTYMERVVTKSHTLKISSWSQAQSRNYGDTKFDGLEEHLGVPSLLLDYSFRDDFCSLVINTVDDRYIELKFYEAQVEFAESIIS
ncbi:hypothetical protein K6U70_09405 [Vibrio vulnificus]|uniref:hypothetical protein n=1 Tax=Vibrio vulnificus TaxID=672 RepID=UPI001EE9C309|nr:hypothetical protein [Vibrio vulnificus]MCG6272372.1 hypothetical protein [Vibrio vulnificus]